MIPAATRTIPNPSNVYKIRKRVMGFASFLDFTIFGRYQLSYNIIEFATQDRFMISSIPNGDYKMTMREAPCMGNGEA